MPITTRNGYPVKVGDVARIEDSVAEAESIATVDGKPAVVLQIRKQSGTNTIDVVDGSRSGSTELKAQLPEGWKMEIVRDQSEFIVAAVDAVKEHLISARSSPRSSSSSSCAASGRRSSRRSPSRARSSPPSRRCSTWASRSTSSRCWR